MRKDIGKFRGKRIDNGEWVEGSFLSDVCEIRVVKDNGAWKSIRNYKVDPESVGEFTDEKDKTGKTICEWDFVLNPYYETDKLKYLLVRYCSGSFWLGDLAFVDVENNDKLEIIGNSTDNPELAQKQP